MPQASSSAVSESELSQWRDGVLSIQAFNEIAQALAIDGSVESMEALARGYQQFYHDENWSLVDGITQALLQLSPDAILTPLFAVIQEMELALGTVGNMEPLISALVKSNSHSNVGYEVAQYYPQNESPALLELALQIPASLTKLTSNAYASGDQQAYDQMLTAHTDLFRESPERGLDAILYSAAQTPTLREALVDTVSNTYIDDIGASHVMALVDELDAQYTPTEDAQVLARLLVNIARTSPEAKRTLDKLREPDMIVAFDEQTAAILNAEPEASKLITSGFSQ